MYGKFDARPGRKMGYVTIIANSMEEVEERARPPIESVDRIQVERKSRLSAMPSTAFPHTQAQHPGGQPPAFKEK